MTKGYDKLDFNLDLLLHLPLKEGTGTTTRDWAKPHHKNPTLTGAPSWTTIAGTDKNVLDFNSGHPDYVIIQQADATDFNFGANDFSISVWGNIDGTWPAGFNAWIGNGQYASNGFMIWSRNTKELRGYIGNTGFETGYFLTSNTWYLVTLVKSGTNLNVYVNGTLVSTNTVQATITNASRPFYVGCVNNAGTPSFQFDGQIGDVWIWNRALPQDEIQALHEFTREEYIL